MNSNYLPRKYFLAETECFYTKTLCEIGTINPIPPGLFEGGAALGGGGRKVPAAYNSKTINDNEMKLGGVVKDH